MPAGLANRSLLQASGFAAGASEPAHATPATGFSTIQQPTVQASNQTPSGSGGAGSVTGIQVLPSAAALAAARLAAALQPQASAGAPSRPRTHPAAQAALVP